MALTLPERTVVDVERVLHGDWSDALDTPVIGSDLFEGFDGIGSPEFELWLLTQRRRVADSAGIQNPRLHEFVSSLGRSGR